MMIRKLLGVLIALAVLFAPAAAAAERMATMPAHDMHAMPMGHCDGPPAKGELGKAGGKSCCLSMCFAVAVAPQAAIGAAEVEHASTYFAVPTSWRGYLAEIATPPPRSA